jgi:hypothetical protein
VDEETAAALQRAEGEGGLDLLSEHTGLLSRRSTALLITAAAMGACGLLLLILSFAALSGAFLPLLGGGLLLLGGLALVLLGLGARRDVLAICRAYGAGGYAALLARLTTLRTAALAEGGYRAAEKEAAARLQTALLEHRRAMGELDTVVRRFDVRLPEEEPDAFLDRLVESVRAMLDKKKAREGERAEAAGLVSAFRQRLRGTNEAAARAALPAGELPGEDELQPEEWKRQVEYHTAHRRRHFLPVDGDPDGDALPLRLQRHIAGIPAAQELVHRAHGALTEDAHRRQHITGLDLFVPDAQYGQVLLLQAAVVAAHHGGGEDHQIALLQPTGRMRLLTVVVEAEALLGLMVDVGHDTVAIQRKYGVG